MAHVNDGVTGTERWAVSTGAAEPDNMVRQNDNGEYLLNRDTTRQLPRRV